jgi:hypothetical protein
VLDYKYSVERSDQLLSPYYSIPATHAKLAGEAQNSFLVSAEKEARDWESCEDVLQRTAENAM